MCGEGILNSLYSSYSSLRIMCHVAFSLLEDNSRSSETAHRHTCTEKL